MNANQAYKRKGQSPVTPRWDAFSALCQSHGLPAPECEVEGLVPGRKFRVDYCWRAQKLVLEVNGQIWHKGGHSSGRGLLRDYEKNNLLQLAGFKVLTYTPQQMNTGACLPVLKVLLAGAESCQPSVTSDGQP